jgi:hypothetical protein
MGCMYVGHPLTLKGERMTARTNLFSDRLLRLILGLPLVLALFLGTTIAVSAAGESSVLKRFPCDSFSGMISRTGVELDKSISSDGQGSFKLTTSKPTTFRLFEVHNLHVDNARLLYEARLRTKDIDGKVYLEMWVHVDGKGEFFSRGVQEPITGTTEWSTQEIPFFLQPGQTADYAKLNIVVEGKGTAWIDSIKLVKAPLN